MLSTLIANMDKMRPLMQGVLDFGKALDSASPGDYARFDLTALLAPGDLSNLPGLSSLPKPGSPTEAPEATGCPRPARSSGAPGQHRRHLRRGARPGRPAGRWGPMSDLLGNRVRTAQVLLLVVVILGALYVMDAVVGSGLIRRPFHVTVDLEGSGGLYPGAVVSYRGNRIGKVTDLDVTEDGVRAVASIAEGHQDPGRHRGRRLQPLRGRRAAARLPTPGRPRSLAEGGFAGREEGHRPPARDEHVVPAREDADRPGRRRATYSTISRELGVAFGDPDLDLRRLYDDGDRTLGTLERLEPATISLIERGQIPLQTLSDNSGQFLAVQQGRRRSHRIAAPGQPRPRLAAPQRQRAGAAAARRARREPRPPSPTCSARAGWSARSAPTGSRH